MNARDRFRLAWSLCRANILVRTCTGDLRHSTAREIERAIADENMASAAIESYDNRRYCDRNRTREALERLARIKSGELPNTLNERTDIDWLKNCARDNLRARRWRRENNWQGYRGP